MEKIIKIAAYCRISTEKTDQINSLINQRIFFNDYINSYKGWKLVKIYADEGISGTSTNKRTEFNNMISDAKSGKIDMIITKEVSRFARNTVDALLYTRLLKSLGIGVIFLNDNINTLDNDGELRLTIMSSIAQEESRKISQRIRWGQKIQMEKGYVFGNGVYGYNLSDGKLTVNTNEAKVVKMIFNLFCNKKLSTYKIAQTLNNKGITPKKSKKFTSASISRILKNEKYIGDLVQSKTVTTDFLSNKREDNFQQKIVIKNHHPPIINKKLWSQAQSILQAGKKTKQTNTYWFSSKVFCGECGKKYTPYNYKSRLYGLRCHSSCEICGKCNNSSITYSAFIKCINYATQFLEKNNLALKKEICSLNKRINSDNISFKEISNINDEAILNVLIEKITICKNKIIIIKFYSIKTTISVKFKKDKPENCEIIEVVTL